MKIILSVNTLGSFISHRRSLYLRLRDRHKVSVLLPLSESPGATPDTIRSEELLTLPMSRKGINPWAELQAIFAYYQQYKKHKPDLVHHFTIKPVIYGTLAARAAGVQRIVNSITGLGFVFTSPTLKAKVLGIIVKTLYRLCLQSPKVKVIFQNQDDRQFFIQHKLLKETQCFLVEGSGVDTEKFKPSNPENNPPKIFLAARLLIEKGLFEFMAALQILKEKNIPFDALVAGDLDPGNPGSVSAEQLTQWKKQNLAQFLGHQTNMVEWLQKIDIACLPSYREGLPMSLLEAMAAGKPLVTTDAPGCRATVKNDINGFLVPIKDPSELATALEKLLAQPALRRQMGQASRQMAIDFFSTEKITSAIEKTYQS
jgi:glycosyltransferase involved in cell wall biosynthesis